MKILYTCLLTCGFFIFGAILAPIGAHAQKGKTIFGKNRAQTTKAMKEIVKALGVRKSGGCLYCHVKEGGKINYTTETPHKKTAYLMKTDFIDKLQKSGKAETELVHDGHKVQLVATYTAAGEKAGIHLSAVAKGEKEAKTYEKHLPLPAKGEALTCNTCHQGAVRFLTAQPKKKGGVQSGEM